MFHSYQFSFQLLAFGALSTFHFMHACLTLCAFWHLLQSCALNTRRILSRWFRHTLKLLPPPKTRLCEATPASSAFSCSECENVLCKHRDWLHCFLQFRGSFSLYSFKPSDFHLLIVSRSLNQPLQSSLPPPSLWPVALARRVRSRCYFCVLCDLWRMKVWIGVVLNRPKSVCH